MPYYIYIAQASDKSFYTGFTNNIEKRIKTHNNGKGSKSLRGKLPVQLVYSEQFESKSDALKREIEIKSFTREKKLTLIDTRG